ncbi:hypothetical protein ACLBKU_04800 [Erythrobacter sp. NE805]|uniref:hypothetical protein n=1 Tax=Erythrobacter sp. NE805 TaxID=3389875 RepID=UPI00396B4367
MEWFGGPAALGGVITGLMLAAWMLGRWQSGLAPPPARRETLADDVPSSEALSRALAGQQSDAADAETSRPLASDERRSALAGGASLGELHEQVSAYRRAEQVLADADVEGLQLYWAGPGACEPAPRAAIGVRHAAAMRHPGGADCACGTCTADCPRAGPPRADQPSLAVPFTRV